MNESNDVLVPDDLADVRTSRLRLRRVLPEHWEEQRLLDTNAEVMATLGGLRSVDTTRAYLDRHVAHWEEHGFGIWTIFDRATDDFVGRGGLRHLTLDDGYAAVEVGYALLPRFWGRGLATEIARTSVSLGRDQVRLDEIIGLTLPTNLRSRSVLEKAGLTYERDTTWKGLPHRLYRWTPES